MGIFKSLIKLFKGGNHAERAEERVSGGDGCERRIIYSFPSSRERAISDICGIRMLAAACADERSRDSGQMPPDKIRGESDILLTDDEIAIVEGRNEIKQKPQGETARRSADSSRRRRQSSTPATPAPTDDEVLE